MKSWKVGSLLSSLIVLILSGCINSTEKIYPELESFDNSLDSLVVEETSGQPEFLIFGDTLKNNPQQIEEIYYMRINKTDSLRVDANCHIYKFENKELVINSSEDFLGRKYVQKYIYFKDKIDNDLIRSLRNHYKNTDTIVFGYLKKYNARGKLVKEVKSGIWREIDKNTGMLIENDNRTLEVYRYNYEGSYYTTFRKSYFNKKYHVDSLKATTAIQQFNTDLNEKVDNVLDYSYTYDHHGNWIVKREINTEYPSIVYRKITY